MFQAAIKTLAATFTIAASFALVGCAAEEESAHGALPQGEFGCQDFDGDGYGIQCDAGSDCDDDDADVGECPQPVEGPCEDGMIKECKEQLPAMGGVENCFVGVQTCEAGEWGPCVEGGSV